jgi:hypothetical protein
MFQSDADTKDLGALASDIAAELAQAIDDDRLDALPSDQLGQLFASIVRFYAAKVQNGDIPRPFGRNSGVTATDVMIGCTAMLQAVRLQAFELAQWQAWTRLGKLNESEDHPR